MDGDRHHRGRSRSGSVDSLGRYKRKREPRRHHVRLRVEVAAIEEDPVRLGTVATATMIAEEAATDEAAAGVAVAVENAEAVGAETMASAIARRLAARGRSPVPDESRMATAKRSDALTQRACLSSCIVHSEYGGTANGGSPANDKKAEVSNRSETNGAEASVVTSTLAHLTEEEQMQALMGFGGFDSTKGKVVEDNMQGAAHGGIRKESKREYRQYMNRRGGFNRPLDQK